MGSSLLSVCFVPGLETNHWVPHYEGVVSVMSGVLDDTVIELGLLGVQVAVL